MVLSNLNFLVKVQFYGPGRFPGNAGNHKNDGKFHKSHQILNQTKRNINKLCFVNLTSLNSKNKIFRGFRVFGYALFNFWKFRKAFFTNQIKNFDDKIILVENEKVVSKNEEIVYLFNT